MISTANPRWSIRLLSDDGLERVHGQTVNILPGCARAAQGLDQGHDPNRVCELHGAERDQSDHPAFSSVFAPEELNEGHEVVDRGSGGGWRAWPMALRTGTGIPATSCALRSSSLIPRTGTGSKDNHKSRSSSAVARARSASRRATIVATLDLTSMVRGSGCVCAAHPPLGCPMYLTPQSGERPVRVPSNEWMGGSPPSALLVCFHLENSQVVHRYLHRHTVSAHRVRPACRRSRAERGLQLLA